MTEFAIFWEWLAFAVRWLHVITAIAWIGSSFYFIALDLGLRQRPGLPEGAFGEEWQVHGGGFYHIQKYLVAPAEMPEHLTWFKWESYATWLSGAALMAIVYWAGAELFLIDSEKADLSQWQAIAISAASLSVGWIVYDLLCKSGLGEKPTLLMILLFILLVIMGWGYNQIFTGKAMMLHLGAFTASIMSANVFFIIMPNQRIVVADLKAGRKPDPKYGKIAKLRSTHNNYLTLPVIFLMLSNHYPLAFATEFNWVIAAIVFLMGVVIRHYFNSTHAHKAAPHWTWLVATILFLVIVWLSTVPSALTGERKLSAAQERFIQSVHFAPVAELVASRCSMCHAAEPVWEGIQRAPKGVVLENEADIAAQAHEIYINAGRSHAMPPGNITGITTDERALIVVWFDDVRG